MGENPDVIWHFPPQVIVGKQVSEDKKLLANFEDEYVEVRLEEIESEYMFGNPTCGFNLSLAEKA